VTELERKENAGAGVSGENDAEERPSWATISSIRRLRLLGCTCRQTPSSVPTFVPRGCVFSTTPRTGVLSTFPHCETWAPIFRYDGAFMLAYFMIAVTLHRNLYNKGDPLFSFISTYLIRVCEVDHPLHFGNYYPVTWQKWLVKLPCTNLYIIFSAKLPFSRTLVIIPLLYGKNKDEIYHTRTREWWSQHRVW
jgi:hypothetical protein